MNFAILFIMSVSWSLHFAFMKSLSAMFSVHLLLFPTLLVMSTFFFVLLHINSMKIKVGRQEIMFFMVAGILGYLAPLFLEFIVSKTMPVGLLVLIVATIPFFTILISTVTKHELVETKHLIAFILGIFGIAPLLLIYKSSNSAIDLSTILITFLIPITYAVYNVYIKVSWPNGLSALQVAFGETVAIAIFSLPFFLHEVQHIALANLCQNLGVLVGFLVSTTIEVWLFFELVKRTSAIYVSFAMLITLIFGYFWGWIYFDEKITFLMLASTICILLSVFSLHTTRLKKIFASNL